MNLRRCWTGTILNMMNATSGIETGILRFGSHLWRSLTILLLPQIPGLRPGNAFELLPPWAEIVPTSCGDDCRDLRPLFSSGKRANSSYEIHNPGPGWICGSLSKFQRMTSEAEESLQRQDSRIIQDKNRLLITIKIKKATTRMYPYVLNILPRLKFTPSHQKAPTGRLHIPLRRPLPSRPESRLVCGRGYKR